MKGMLFVLCIAACLGIGIFIGQYLLQYEQRLASLEQSITTLKVENAAYTTTSCATLAKELAAFKEFFVTEQVRDLKVSQDHEQRLYQLENK